MTEESSKLIRQIESDPVYRWGKKQLNQDGRDHAVGPRMAWALQQTVALNIVQEKMAVHDVSNSALSRTMLTRQMLEASTVLWSREIFEAATESDLQEVVHNRTEGVPAASFWVVDSLVETPALSVFAFALIPDRPDRTLVAPVGGPHAGFIPIEVKYGSTREQHRQYWTALADRTDGHFMIDLADLCFRVVVLGSAFLASPYIPKERETVGKPRRKDSISDRRNAKPRDVTVVNLRRAMAEHGDAGAGEGASESERRTYSRRWIVSGHFRNQAHGPGHTLRKTIWIPAYMKGPDDAALSKTIYRAIR